MIQYPCMSEAGDKSIDESAKLLARVLGIVRTLAGARSVQPWTDVDLSMPQFRLLMTVASTGGLTGRDIARHLRIGPSAVTPVVDRLVSQGLVRREPDENDRRVIWVRPTSRGQQLRDRLFAANRDALRDLLGDLDPAELKTVHDAVRILDRQAGRRLRELGQENEHHCAPSRSADRE